jgi:hypothetical protein
MAGATDFNVKQFEEEWKSELRRGVLFTNKNSTELLPAHFHDCSNVPTFDILSLEDVSLSDFMVKSPDNIVLKIGSQFYAFDRRVLIDYMSSKRVFVNDRIGYIFETPHRQYLSSVKMSLLYYDLFRIYELYDESRVPLGSGTVSVYNVRTFGVVQCLDAMIII